MINVQKYFKASYLYVDTLGSLGLIALRRFRIWFKRISKVSAFGRSFSSWSKYSSLLIAWLLAAKLSISDSGKKGEYN